MWMQNSLKLVLLLAGTAGAAELQPFESSYVVVWHGMTAGTMRYSLKHEGGDRWVYRSSGAPSGVFRAFLPSTISQTSDMRLTTAGIQPLRYRGDDGPESTKRDVDLTFDWDRQRVTGVAEERKVDDPLSPGVQDDISVQIALMHELQQGHTPTEFKTYGTRGERNYTYARDGEETLQTPLGAIATIIYATARPGSDRVTRYWCAPSQGYLPLRAQQRKGSDKVEWTMEIRSLKRD